MAVAAAAHRPAPRPPIAIYEGTLSLAPTLQPNESTQARSAGSVCLLQFAEPRTLQNSA